MFLPDSKTVLLQVKARYNEELSQCHFQKLQRSEFFIPILTKNVFVGNVSAYFKSNCLEMPVPSQGHYGFHSFSVVD
jgi:hypothetical protein